MPDPCPASLHDSVLPPACLPPLPWNIFVPPFSTSQSHPTPHALSHHNSLPEVYGHRQNYVPAFLTLKEVTYSTFAMLPSWHNLLWAKSNPEIHLKFLNDDTTPALNIFMYPIYLCMHSFPLAPDLESFSFFSSFHVTIGPCVTWE